MFTLPIRARTTHAKSDRFGTHFYSTFRFDALNLPNRHVCTTVKQLANGNHMTVTRTWHGDSLANMHVTRHEWLKRSSALDHVNRWHELGMLAA
jgi:hypothetical protein